MHLLFSIAFNALILASIAYFLPYDAALQTGVIASGGWQLYVAGGIVLGLLNAIIRPILKVLGFPFILITFGLFILVINGVILALLEKIIRLLNLSGVSYSIEGWVNFAIAVAIFTVFNIVYNAFLKK